MRHLSLALATCLAASTLTWAGCEDEETTNKDSGVDLAISETSTSDLPTSETASDTAPQDLPPTDFILPASALQVVVNKLTLPTTATEYAKDLDGNGTKDNQLGGLLGVLGPMFPTGYKPQEALDQQITEGKFIMLFDVLASSITSDSAAKLRFYLGKDTDSDYKDNFSGSETFLIDSSSPTNLILSGSITSSKLTAGPGSLLAPIPLSTTPITVTLKKSYVESTLSSTPLSAMTSGQLNGAIPMSDVYAKLLPPIATMMDTAYKNPATPAALLALLKLLDTDGNGTITATDLQNNLLIGAFIKADVDLNGDGKIDNTNDGMSMGMGFTGVSCTINTGSTTSDY